MVVRKENEIISFSVPKGTASDIEALAGAIGYSNRSELIRDAIQMLQKSKLDLDRMEGTVEGVIITLYSHGAEPEVSGIRHRNMELIKSFMHTDFNERTSTCCDVLFFSGQADKVKSLIFGLQTVKNVNEVRMFIA